MLTRKALILAKVESAYGTDPTPTPASDAIDVYDLSLRVDGKILTRELLDASLSRRAHVSGRKLVNVEFKTELKGSGTAGTPPDVDPLWRAAGHGVTNVPATSDTYAPISSSFQSVYLYTYWDGILVEVAGCYFDVDLDTPAGEFGFLTWRGIGLYVAPTDVAIPGGVTTDTTIAPVIQSAALTLGGYSTGVIERLNLRWGIQIPERPDLNSVNGLKGLNLTGREITGSVNPEAVTEATHTFWANFAAGTEVAMSATFGSAAGNRVKINTAPKVQYGPPQFGDRNGTRIYDLPIFLNRSAAAGDDEISVVYD